MNIFDCFMYFDEDLLLDIRLNSLDNFVKKFLKSLFKVFYSYIFCSFTTNYKFFG